MLQIKENLSVDKLRTHDFYESLGCKSHVEKTIGALNIYINLETREIYGIGFYPVGDRIVLNNLTDGFKKECLKEDVKGREKNES